MLSDAKYYPVLALLILLATWLRIAHLDSRPMHTDEAVHAVKFGDLLENGTYVYDFEEYHGPTLNYLTLVPAWLRNQNTFAELDETTLRIVPAVAGIFLCASLLLFTPALSRTTLVFSVLFLSLSPAFVFYSRYYIQEMLLIFFSLLTILAAFKFFHTQKVRWAAAGGMSLGLMNATKETWIISAAAMVISFVAAIYWEYGRLKLQRTQYLWSSLGIALVCFLIISLLFFSSFGTNPMGVWHSVYTYFTYFDRAANNSLHIHSWTYYLQILSFFKLGNGPIWTEFSVLALAVAGIYSVLKTSRASHAENVLPRFFVIYSLLMLLIYCLIPYKTPWNALNFYLGFIVLAGIGAARIYASSTSRGKQVLTVTLLFLVAIHLGYQAVLATGTYDADPVNPYVYGHTHPDVLEIVAEINSFATAQEERNNLYIQVMCSGKDYWPLPWYLRHFTQTGWWSAVPDSIPLAPLVVLSPDLESDFVHHNYELSPPGKRYLYIPLFREPVYLRPGVELRCYARKKEWDLWQQREK
ncbi:TIGR03663 family protein [candidate division KSB1 bacterium]|nr:TIGR03663 family protein [candidate division KSB1 bacterium]